MTASWLDDFERELGHRTIDAGEARTVIIRRHYDAPIDDVWAACTEPERLNRFFLEPEGDLQEGGTYSLPANASGTILRCEPPTMFRLSWAYGDRPVDEVELRLTKAADGGTVLELEHASVAEQFVVNDPVTGDWGVGPAWETTLDYLGQHLAGELPDAPAAEWFEFTEELASRVTQRSLAWGQAVEHAYARLVRSG